MVYSHNVIQLNNKKELSDANSQWEDRARGKLDNGTGREEWELGKLRQRGAPDLWPENAGAKRRCWQVDPISSF